MDALVSFSKSVGFRIFTMSMFIYPSGQVISDTCINYTSPNVGSDVNVIIVDTYGFHSRYISQHRPFAVAQGDKNIVFMPFKSPS